MFLAEPPRSEGDLRFRIGTIPVRIHPMFWLVTVLLGLGGGNRETPPAELVVWLVAVTASILVHELGHAWMQRRFGGRPWITLYGMGGMASCDDCDRRSTSQIQISLAGPFAGFLAAFALAACLMVVGRRVGWGSVESLRGIRGIGTMDALVLAKAALYWEPPASPILASFVHDLFYINIFWGLVNLLPVYPLDGGQVARELLQLAVGPSRGIAHSLALSMGIGAMVAFYFLTQSRFYSGAFFGYLAYQSYLAWNAYRAHHW